MGKSFFLGTDHELFTGSNGFSDQISATPAAFGLTSSQASAYASLNAIYSAAYLVANNELTRTKGTVAAKNDAKKNLKIMASDLAKAIDSNPAVTTQQKEDLNIRVRAAAQPMPPPGTPTDGKATLNGMGAVNLTFKCKNPTGSSGTVYQIWRQADDGALMYLGGTGEKAFVDSTVPAGTSVLTYKVQAVRSTASGDWATFVVTFGNSGTVGNMGMSLATETKSAKLAA
jgi:hypothetical protein